MASRYQIYVTDWEFGYTDNKPDNIVKASYSMSGSQANRNALINSLRSINGTVELPTIEAGKCVLKLEQGYGSYNPTQIVLKDTQTDWYYFYFCENTGRLINRTDYRYYYEEFKITLNNYATYLEPMIIRSINEQNTSGGFNLFKNLQAKSSNHMPQFWTSSDSSLTIGGYNNTRWGWFQSSIITLPEYLNVQENSSQVFANLTNVFNSTWAPNTKNFKYANCFYDAESFSPVAYTLRLSNIIFRANEYINETGQQGIKFKVFYKDKAWMENVPNGWQWTQTMKLNNVREFIQACDTDEWALYSISGNWMNDGHDTMNWEGFGGNGTTSALIVAVPYNRDKRNYASIELLERFGDRKDNGMGFLGIFKMKINNIFESYRPTSVVALSCNDLQLGCLGNQKDSILFGFVLSGFGWTYTTTVKDRNLAWYNTKNISLVNYINQAFTANSTLRTNIRTAAELMKASLYVNSNFVASTNIDDKWINYDWTTYRNSPAFQLSYTMMGYEMTWIIPTDTAFNPTQPVEPWKSNRFSLGLSNVKVNNLEKYNNSAQATINSNSHQWEVSQNLANFKYEQEENLAPWRAANTISKQMSFNGIVSNFLNSGAGISQAYIELEEQRTRRAELNAETQRLPAVKQDIMNNITVSFPAGNILWTASEPIGITLYGWNIPFRVQAFNYVNTYGWKNILPEWNPSYLTPAYASNIFTCSSFNETNKTYSLTPIHSISNVSFVRDDINLIQNLEQASKIMVNGYSTRLALTSAVKNWFIAVFEKGLKIKFPAQQARGDVNTLKLDKNVDLSKVILKPRDYFPPEEPLNGSQENAQATTQTKTKRGANCEPCKANRQRTRTRAKKADSVDNRVRAGVPKSEG